MKNYILVTALLLISPMIYAQENATDKTKFLVHITVGPENPTRAALGFLVARSAIEQGHSVAIFLAGDGVQLIRNNILDNLVGVGTGSLREHFDVIVKKGGRFYLSGMSSKARGVTQEDLQNKPAELAMPEVLVRLSLESEKMFVY